MRQIPTKARLQELFNYDSATGNFIRKIRTSKSTQIGAIAGTIDRRDNTRQMLVDSKGYRQSHIVWLWHTDEWPTKEIECVNGDKLDCRIENLRFCLRVTRDDTIPLTLERLKQVLDYNAETGIFTWKAVLGKNSPIGSRAGSKMSNNLGYRVVVIDGHLYLEGRLAWFYSTGCWPTKPLRFQNKDRTDCRISNLCVGRYLSTKHNNSTKEGRSAYRKEYRQKFPDVVKDSDLRKDFGISLIEYNAMFAAQDGKCAICIRPETATRHGKLIALSVDHNHETNQIRGLLCQDCNLMIGKAHEKLSTLSAAIDYLTTYSKSAKT